MRRYNLNRHRRNSGLTLVELMVAIAISLLLTVAIGGVFLSSKSSFRYQDAMSRVQENARFAMEKLSRDIRIAGYNGCGSLSTVANTVIGGTGSLWLDLTTPVMGYEGGVSAFPTEFSEAVAGTDAIILKGVDPSTELAVISHNAAAAQINTTVNTIPAGEILIITDCSQTSIFQMTGPSSASKTNIVHNTGTGIPGNCTKYLGASCPGSSTPYTFKPGASLLRMYANGYYIKPSATAGVGNSLWMRSITGQTTGVPADVELINGVENMQIEYGVDTDADSSANKYIKADAITAADWAKVVSVKVSLLLATPATDNNLSSKSQTYTYNGVTTTATDRRVRHVYTSVINLRNRTK
ncbi:MAG: PilW family protein [Sulfuricella sp.]